MYIESSQIELCTCPISLFPAGTIGQRLKSSDLKTSSDLFKTIHILKVEFLSTTPVIISHYFPPIATHFVVCSTYVSTFAMPSSGGISFWLQTKHYFNLIVCAYKRF
jgi:hypothetical protein